LASNRDPKTSDITCPPSAVARRRKPQFRPNVETPNHSDLKEEGGRREDCGCGREEFENSH
jgi:hypothetical protein